MNSFHKHTSCGAKLNEEDSVNLQEIMTLKGQRSHNVNITYQNKGSSKCKNKCNHIKVVKKKCMSRRWNTDLMKYKTYNYISTNQIIQRNNPNLMCLFAYCLCNLHLH